MPKVLIVDDDEIFLEAVNKSLLSEGFEVTTAANGKIALSQLKTQKFDLVISDVRMPEMDGVELIKAIRQQSKVPVILMTGFAEIMETKAAYELGANEFIPKPFKFDELSQAIGRCLSGETGAKASAQANADEQYCKLGINDFISGRTIKFNIFVKLAPNKYIKIAHKGEDVTPDRIQFYRNKGLTFLYLKKADFRQYVSFNLTLTQVSRQTNIIDPKKKLALLRHTGEILNEQIRVEGIDDQLYESAEAFVEATIDIISDDVRALDVLTELKTHADYVLIHSVAVSMYSLMIAQMVDWNLPTNRFKVAMGGLLHDLGMKELSSELMTKPRYSWSKDEVKDFEGHTLRSVNILRDIPGISDDVYEIVKQHHENCLGFGFPMGTKSASIHPMAKVISVADEFCYRVIKNPLHDEMSPGEAIQDMVIRCSEQLDKRFFTALMQLFKKPIQTKVSRIS